MMNVMFVTAVVETLISALKHALNVKVVDSRLELLKPYLGLFNSLQSVIHVMVKGKFQKKNVKNVRVVELLKIDNL